MTGKHKCSQCNAAFPHQSKLQRHMETHMITGDWICGLCNTLCLRLHTLIQHWKVSCWEFHQVICDDDRKAMTNDEIQEAAFRLILDRYSSDIPPDYDDAGPSVQLLFERESKPSICIYCSLHFPRGTLSTHYGVHSNQNRPGTQTKSSRVPYVCDLCGFGFRFKKSLYKHWRHTCCELLAQCPPEGMTIDNRGLRKMVEDLVKQAEVVSPYEIADNRREDEEDADKNYEGQEDEDRDEETEPSYTSHITPPEDANHEFWNVGNQQNPHNCHRCTRKFHSYGRLQLHLDAFHDSKRAFIECELCLNRFTENRSLMNHLKTSCRAIKIERPDFAKRRKVNNMEVLEVVAQARHRWRGLFEHKKRENFRYMTEYINRIDKKLPPPPPEERLVPILDVPVPRESFMELPTDDTYCAECKIKFRSARFLFQHQLAVHTVHSNPGPPRNQYTITAASLLPYFKLEQGVFYDSMGRKYRMGKLLEKGKDVTRHLGSRIVVSETRVENVAENDCFVVPLLGRDNRHVLLNQEEFRTVCDATGRLKSLFIENPRSFDDIPQLTRENNRV